jgi:hypothetical protein
VVRASKRSGREVRAFPDISLSFSSLPMNKLERGLTI